MSVIGQSITSFNSSTTSQNDNYGGVETTKVKNYVKDLLKSRIFLGRYLERRFIDQSIGYRDIVLISSAEVELKKDLLEAQYKLSTISPNLHFIGIIEATAIGIHTSGICIWTEIENQPFGAFWFQIKSLKFRPEECMLSLKCVRHISDAYLELEPLLTGQKVKKVKEAIDKTNIECKNGVETLSDTFNEIVGNVKGAMSISNVKELMTFLFALVIAFFTGSVAFVNFLGDFVLALIREMSIFIKNSTPMFLGLLDFCSKIVGGFYILLAMMFRPSNPPQNKQRLGSRYNNYSPRMEIYDDKQFD